jgi:hypothetical protein
MTEKSDIKKVLSIPISLFASSQGEYFVGQTELLVFGQGNNAWAGLVNPRNSEVNLHVNVITFTNFSEVPFTAHIWFNPTLPVKPACSSNKCVNAIEATEVSTTNFSLDPLPKPKIELQYVQNFQGFLSGGVNVFNRIVPPKTTLVEDEDCKFIFPPKIAFAVLLESTGSGLLEARIAFGWCEKKIRRN